MGGGNNSLGYVETHQKQVNSNLFSLVLKIIDVCSRNTFCCIRQDSCSPRQPLRRSGTHGKNIPASVRFPLRVKLVLRAPVPAYILDNASPFSAHNSRWYDHSEFEFNHSLRERSRYCSRLVLDKMSCTKFVRSRLITKCIMISLRGVGEQTIRRRIRTSQDSWYGRFLFVR
jgi:hypothetical protein